MSALGPCPAPWNLSTYMPSSSASTMAGSDPPSRNGVTYLVAMTVLTFIVGHVLHDSVPPAPGCSRPVLGILWPGHNRAPEPPLLPVRPPTGRSRGLRLRGPADSLHQARYKAPGAHLARVRHQVPGRQEGQE